MDPEIRELKELIRNQSAIIEETNHLVRKIRSASRWSLVFQILWWLSIIGVTGAIYYVYLAPYLEQILELYGNAQNVLQNFRPQ